jgi:glutathione S-transferase
MKAKLYGIPGSHNTFVAEAMLRHKGIGYARRDLVPPAHRLFLLRLLGFDGTSVPALKIDGRRVVGSRAVSRLLDEIVPEPPLFPADPERRRAVEDAERFGEERLQRYARHVLWAALRRDSRAARSFLADARLGFPTELAGVLIAPAAWLMARMNGATEATVRAELASLPGDLAEVDALLERGVIGGAERNAADFQIAAQLRILMCLDDLRPTIEAHRAGAFALDVFPRYPGHLPSVLSGDERAVLAG